MENLSPEGQQGQNWTDEELALCYARLSEAEDRIGEEIEEEQREQEAIRRANYGGFGQWRTLKDVKRKYGGLPDDRQLEFLKNVRAFCNERKEAAERNPSAEFPEAQPYTNIVMKWVEDKILECEQRPMAPEQAPAPAAQGEAAKLEEEPIRSSLMSEKVAAIIADSYIHAGFLSSSERNELIKILTEEDGHVESMKGPVIALTLQTMRELLSFRPGNGSIVDTIKWALDRFRVKRPALNKAWYEPSRKAKKEYAPKIREAFRNTAKK
jgi:hypothetical protein